MDAVRRFGIGFFLFGCASTGVGAAWAQPTEFYSFLGEANGDQFGFAVDGARDLDGDGTPDLVVGAATHGGPGGFRSGKVYVLSGADGSLVRTFDGEATEDDFGWSVASVGDVNGDSRADIVVGALYHDGAAGADSGKVYVYSGASGALIRTFEGATAGDRLGRAVAGTDDVDGDAVADIALGAPGYDGVGSNSGRAYLYSGATGALLRTWDGEGMFENFGQTLVDAGDVNGDNVPDVAVAAPGNAGANAGGRVRVFSGATGAVIHTFDGETGNASMGDALARAGDLDGDTVPDLLVGALQTDLPVLSTAGKVYLFSGASGALLDTWRAEQFNMFFGSAVAGGVDVDGDATPDIVVGGEAYSGAGPGTTGIGRAYVISGATRAILACVDGANESGGLGATAAAMTDLSGDGVGEVVVAAPAYMVAPLPGVVRVFSDIPSCADADGDGATSCGGDCNDCDAAVHPGAAEVFNGIDDNCDGTVDEGFGDADGDGVPDNIDNCPGFFNPLQTDDDADGWGPPCDCDDANAAINPDAAEIPGNGIDDDCDGADLPPVGPGWIHAFDGEGAGDAIGSVAGIADVNGDAVPDYLVGAAAHDGPAGVDSGKVYVRSGSSGALIASIDGAAAGDLFGWAVAGGGDVNGDSVGDFAVTAPGAAGGMGRVTFYSGATRAVLGSAVGSGGFFGLSVAGLGDVSGDAVGDWAVGAPFKGSFSEGTVHVYSGATSALLGSKLGPRENSSFGWSVSGVSDVDGDAVADVVVGAPGYPYQPPAGPEEPAGGAVSVLSGATLAQIRFATGENTGASLGTSVAGVPDVNGDGRGDFVAGSPFLLVSGVGLSGRAYLHSGASGAVIQTWDGSQDGERFGFAIGTAGDVDGDAVADLVLGAPNWDGPLGADTGRVVVVSGSTGAVLIGHAGEAGGGLFGAPVAGLGDVSGDGSADIVVAATAFDGPGGADAGKVYVFGNCADNDGDGVTVCAGDCDDTNPNVHPGAPEIPGNGIDDDCNPGTPGGCTPQVAAAAAGTVNAARAGADVAWYCAMAFAVVMAWRRRSRRA